MIKKTALAFMLGTVLLPLSARADWWTEGQRQWARHGSHHGRWDCYGNCPEGRHFITTIVTTTIDTRGYCDRRQQA